MYDIRIPASLYQQAITVAKAERVSIEKIIREALQLHVQGEWKESEALTRIPERARFERHWAQRLSFGISLSRYDDRRSNGEV